MRWPLCKPRHIWIQRTQMCCGLHRGQRYQRLCDARRSSADKETLVMLQAALDFTALKRSLLQFATFAQLPHLRIFF